MSVPGDGEDRLSALPDDIIHQILSFIRTKYAIQTGILSKRWRHLWQYNQVIEFQTLPFSNFQPIDYTFLNQCLGLHRSTQIRKFIIIAQIGSASNPDFKNWVDFAIRKQVRYLEFYWKVQPVGGRLFELPDSFYTHRADCLKKLVLSNADFSRTVEFNGVTMLSLSDCKITDHAIDSILSSCLKLESLSLRRCHGMLNVKIFSAVLKEFYIYKDVRGRERSVEIDAPNLRIFRSYLFLPILKLKNCGPLQEVKLFNLNIKDTDKGHVRTLLGQVAATVETFGFNAWFPKVMMEEYYSIDGRCTAFKNLKQCYLSGLTCYEYYMLSLLAFLEDCPLLQKLQIDLRNSCWNDVHRKLPAGDLKLKSVHSPEIDSSFVEVECGQVVPQLGLLLELKFVEFFYFSGYKCEMELAKHLLQKAVSLDTLSLIFEDPEQCFYERFRPYQIPILQREMLREQVSHFSRASPHAQIVIG